MPVLAYPIMSENSQTTCRLLFLVGIGKVRVLRFQEPKNDGQTQAHLVEMTENELGPPRGSKTTDNNPGRFNRGFAAGDGEAMSHAETKLDLEVEKRAITQVAEEINDLVKELKCSNFTMAAPQEHLKRMEAALDPECKAKLADTIGSDLTKLSLADLEKRFL